MKLHELQPAAGSAKANWRKGRGPGSGNGKTAGKGHKGQNARSGGGVRLGFEGGQFPFTELTPREVSTTFSLPTMQLLTLKISTSSLTVP